MLVRKTIITLTFTVIALLFIQSNVYASSISVIVNGSKQSYDQPPVIENSRTLVPIRAISEGVGASVSWNSTTQTVTIHQSHKTITLKIGSKNPTVNGSRTSIDVPSKIINGRTMVPLRFVGEALDANVGFHHQTKVITVTTKAHNELVARTRDQVVLVHKVKHGIRFDPPEMGVIISPSLVLTTYYGANHAEAASIELNNGKEHKVEGIVDLDNRNQVALLKLSEPIAIEPVKMKPTSHFTTGQRTTALKWQAGGSIGISIQIHGSDTDFEGFTHYFSNRPYSFKYQGSPMFDGEGSLIGLVDRYGYYENKQHVRPLDLKKWQPYLTMEHSHIRTSGFYYALPSQPLKTVSTISLGMTWDEVQAHEKGNLHSESTRYLSYRNDAIRPNGYASYHFNSALTLTDIRYDYLNEGYNMTRSQAEELFDELVNKLAAVHGTPQDLEKGWKNHAGREGLRANWAPQFNEEKPTVYINVVEMGMHEFSFEISYHFHGSYKE